LARFCQTITNATPQNPSIKYLLAKQGNNLVDIDNNIVYSNVFTNSTNLLWETTQIFDPDHLTTAYAAPTLAPASTSGAFPVGTYFVTYAFGLVSGGKTAASPEATITISTASKALRVTVPTVPVGVNTVYVYTTAPNGASGTELLASPTSFTVAAGTAPTLVVTAYGSGSAQPTVGTNNLSPSDVLVITTGAGGPYIFDGYSVYVPPYWTSGGVTGAAWCQVVNNVLWFGGIPSQTNLVAGTALGFPEGNNNSAVNLQPTGLPGYANFAFTNPVTGLGVLGAGPQAGLFVGQTAGASVLFGTAPGNYFIQDVPSSDGVASGHAILSYAGIVYFLGKQAFYSYDGSSNPAPISPNIEPWVLNGVLNQDFSMKGDRTAVFGMEYNNRLHWWYDYEGSGYNRGVLVYDLVVQGWTPLQLNDAFSDACLINGPGDPSPQTACTVGFATGQAYNWDVIAAVQPSGQSHAVSDNGVAIPSAVYTKFFKIGVPGTPKKMMRLYPELFVEQFSGTCSVTTDYGASQASGLLSLSPAMSAVWDTAIWDTSSWAANAVQTFLGAPATRIDLNEVGEAFSFSIQTNSTNPPYILQGFTGVYKQETRV
jgi:hypothetical protein